MHKTTHLIVDKKYSVILCAVRTLGPPERIRTNIVLNIFSTSLFKFFFTVFNEYMNQHPYVVRLYNIIQIY